LSNIKTGKCHCEAVEFEVQVIDDFDNIRRCNCSLCRKKGAIIASVPLDKLKVTKGEDNLSLYQWNTKKAKHYFCKTCGIYTHHQRRSDPTQFGFNVACIEGVDPFSFDNIAKGDGASQALI
jgi:hypothetical protein